MKLFFNELKKTVLASENNKYKLSICVFQIILYAFDAHVKFDAKLQLNNLSTNVCVAAPQDVQID